VCPDTAIFVSSYYYICVLILLYMCVDTGVYVYFCIYTNFCVGIRRAAGLVVAAAELYVGYVARAQV
jgi:hypothetical protein